ncbi:hypothetical protein [Gordonia tangerina]|uniref:SGNH hydrolase-type esterase domain-containing protein n=1 Tax=Gordonia tangerina TaxID=2911060 RepID=A0ABS9DRP4_9ACTN|nr:hypothetical protein [Gordonia tangerina]MCF3941304.1 hypothetical protein [Gordonia tangerina]
MAYVPVGIDDDGNLPDEVMGNLSGAYARVGGSAQRGTHVPVATRTALTYMRAKSDGSATQETSRVTHVITADCFNLRVYYGNITSNANAVSPVDGDNAITVKCDVEDASGKRKRGWTTTGARSMTIEPGGHGYFTVQGTFKKGDRIYTRTHVSVASAGMKWPRGLTTNTGPQAGLGEGVTVGSDLTLPSTTAVSQSFVWVYSPAMILGEVATPAPTVAIIGDSIAASQADNADRGFIVRALEPLNLGYVWLPQQGETMSMWHTADEGGGRAVGLDHVSHAICQYGVNDIFNNGNSLATWQTNALKLWTALAQRGISVFQTTITPKSSSTDSWATTANQTAAAQTGVRNSVNDWLRAGAPLNPSTLAAVAVGTAGALLAGQPDHPLTGYFEVADQAESARNSGLWKVTGTANYATGDGTHPSGAMHTLMAAGIDASRLTL